MKGARLHKHHSKIVTLLSILLLVCNAAIAATMSLSELAQKDECPFKYKLTTDEEFLQVVGNPAKTIENKDGGIHLKVLKYKDGNARFIRSHDAKHPYSLVSVWVYALDGPMDIGQDRAIVLTNTEQLQFFTGHTGLEGVDLSKLNLQTHAKLLFDSPFDTKTKWPEATKLPKGFSPQKMLEKAKYPGLGIRELHKEGITGEGIRIAIMDQPPLLHHEDYRHAFEFYDNTKTPRSNPQMHGAALASISVGKSCGVAPGAKLHYYSVPMWKGENTCYIDSLNAIVEKNKTLPKEQRVRAIACSTAMFYRYPRYDEYRKALERAWKSGIVVFTCEDIKKPKFYYCMLNCKRGADPDKVQSYEPVSWKQEAFLAKVSLWIPGGTRTVASPNDPSEYDYDKDCGSSWGTPFLAGLTALALQLNLEMKPDEIINLLHKTAHKTKFGLVVNPKAFVKAARAAKK
mgnify:CR=1 FL=1